MGQKAAGLAQGVEHGVTLGAGWGRRAATKPKGSLGDEPWVAVLRDRVAVLRDGDTPTSPQPSRQHDTKQATSPAANKSRNRGGRETTSQLRTYKGAFFF